MIIVPVKSLVPIVLDSSIEVLYLKKTLISLRGRMIGNDKHTEAHFVLHIFPVFCGP